MILLALLLALAAAVFHAAWNVVLKGNADPLGLAVRAQSSATILVTPAAAAAWLLVGRPAPPPGAWALALISAGVELVYFVFLSRAYRLGDLSAVYPLARGAAPVLAVIAGVLFLGERPSRFQIVGVVLLLGGIWLLRRPGAAGKATVPALLTGVAIAAYTTLDRVGVRLTDAWMYAWILALFTSSALVLVELVRRKSSRDVEISTPTPWRLAGAAGLLMFAAYFMVLLALALAPVSLIAPVRESAVALVAGWGMIRLRERAELGVRIAGVAAILGGLLLVAV